MARTGICGEQFKQTLLQIYGDIQKLLEIWQVKALGCQGPNIPNADFALLDGHFDPFCLRTPFIARVKTYG